MVACVVFGVGLLTGCRSFFGSPYAAVVDEGFEELADADEMCERISSGRDLVLRYEFLTSAPFGGQGVLPALADNVKIQVGAREQSFAGKGSYVRKGGVWNFSEVIVRDGRLEVYLNGSLVTTADKVTSATRWVGYQGKEQYRNIRVKMLQEAEEASEDDEDELPVGPAVAERPTAVAEAPSGGFEACFTGDDAQLKAMWKGVTTAGGYDSPLVRQEATSDELAAMQIIADRSRDDHWHVRNGALYFDGFRGGTPLATKKDYGDFEMWADWRLLSAGDNANTGIGLRGSPRVQIRDVYNQGGAGSGGLSENRENPSEAAETADRPIGDWNRFHVVMLGREVWVWLNGVLVVDGVTFENSWNRTMPIFPVGQIELQGAGDPVEWRNVYIREL